MDQLEEARAWDDAASGLDTHRHAVVFRIVIVVASVLYVVSQIMAKSGGEPGGFTLALAVAELMTTVMAIAGVARFAGRAPRSAASAASLAPMFLIGVALAQIWVVWISYRIMQFTSAASHTTSMWNMPSIGDLMDQAKIMPYVAIGAGIAGMVSLLLVLGGIQGVARALNNDALVKRARGMMVAIVILGIGYGAIQRWVTTGRVNNGAIGALAMLAVFGIIVLFGYISILGTASQVMREPAAATLPVAEVRIG